MINREDFYILSVHHFPAAAKAGVTPVPYIWGGTKEPQYYNPHELYFQSPPTRAEFLQLVDSTPWMQSWEKTLLPAVRSQPWPMITVGHKAVEQTFTADFDGQTRVFARIYVRRHDIVCNPGYSPVDVFVSRDALPVIIRLRPRDREKARVWVETNFYLIAEKCARPEFVNKPQEAIRELLQEAGFIPPKKGKQ